MEIEQLERGALIMREIEDLNFNSKKIQKWIDSKDKLTGTSLNISAIGLTGESITTNLDMVLKVISYIKSSNELRVKELRTEFKDL